MGSHHDVCARDWLKGNCIFQAVPEFQALSKVAGSADLFLLMDKWTEGWDGQQLLPLTLVQMPEPETKAGLLSPEGWGRSCADGTSHGCVPGSSTRAQTLDKKREPEVYGAALCKRYSNWLFIFHPDVWHCVHMAWYSSIPLVKHIYCLSSARIREYHHVSVMLVKTTKFLTQGEVVSVAKLSFSMNFCAMFWSGPWIKAFWGLWQVT